MSKQGLVRDGSENAFKCMGARCGESDINGSKQTACAECGRIKRPNGWFSA